MKFEVFSAHFASTFIAYRGLLGTACIGPGHVECWGKTVFHLHKNDRFLWVNDKLGALIASHCAGLLDLVGYALLGNPLIYGVALMIL